MTSAKICFSHVNGGKQTKISHNIVNQTQIFMQYFLIEIGILCKKISEHFTRYFHHRNKNLYGVLFCLKLNIIRENQEVSLIGFT